MAVSFLSFLPNLSFIKATQDYANKLMENFFQPV